ncbi:hypothetical protein [Brevibacillus borstelensis]
MDIKKTVEEQVISIQDRLKKDSNDLSIEEYIMLHQQLENYISLLLRV